MRFASGLTSGKTIDGAETKSASFGNINRAGETQIGGYNIMIQRIRKPFGAESAKDLQAAIDAAEQRGMYLSDIILSAPCRPDEILGENGYLLIFQKQEAKAHE